MLVDFSASIDVYDFSYNRIGDVPYIIDLADVDDNFFQKFYYNEKHLRFDDYYYVSEDNMLLPLKIDNKIRDYYVSGCKMPVKDMSNVKKK